MQSSILLPYSPDVSTPGLALMVRLEEEWLDAGAAKAARFFLLTKYPHNLALKTSREVVAAAVAETPVTWVVEVEVAEEVLGLRCLLTIVDEILHREQHRPS